jgi:hypothetical protein
MDAAMSPNENAARFGGFVMAHTALVASELEEGEFVCPFAVVEKDGSREVWDFEAGTQQEAVQRGKASFHQLQPGTDAWAFAREGLMSRPDSSDKQDVLLVSAWAPGLEEPLVLIQAFNPAPSGGFALIGELEIHAGSEPLAPSVEAMLQAEALIGVALHPRSVPWTEWRGHKV